MPEEIKDYQFSEEEREMGTKLLDTYNKATIALFNNYIQFHDLLLAKNLTHSDYMKKRFANWTEYKKKDDELHEQFLDDCETLGFKLRAL
jgi:hypothetical protein